jgi:hypothetical protein
MNIPKRNRAPQRKRARKLPGRDPNIELIFYAFAAALSPFTAKLSRDL